jgi:hypothetical protein
MPHNFVDLISLSSEFGIDANKACRLCPSSPTSRLDGSQPEFLHVSGSLRTHPALLIPNVFVQSRFTNEEASLENLELPPGGFRIKYRITRTRSPGGKEGEKHDLEVSVSLDVLSRSFQY